MATTSGTKDSVKGKINRGVGKVKEEIGDATDNRSLEMKGKGQQLKGRVQEGIGRTKRTLND